MTSDFLAEARARGFVNQITDEAALDAAFGGGVVSGYIGFDPTADSLHVGSMVQIMLLRLLQRHGHRPVALLGGGTARIGDPSGREEARPLMTAERLEENRRGVLACIEPYLRFGDGPGDALLVDNGDWLDRLGYIELLREVGPHVSVSRMLSFDSVRQRLDREQGLSFLEFNYSILQSYDFRELRRRHGVTLQMGGRDQWGNIVSGVDLIRRTDAAATYGLTTPLVTTASGAKMGKTAAGAVWLRAERLSPYAYWQFWRNTEDADVGRFLRLFTDLPLDEIDRLAALGGAEINEAKRILATEATGLCHGTEAAAAAEATARTTFEAGGTAADLPTHLVSAETLAAGVPAYRLFAEAGLASSNGEARRLIRGSGARVNDVVLTDEGAPIDAALLRDGAIKLSAGRKQHVLIRTEPGPAAS
jgi:tyrosyl-tRNA synthetase